MMRDKLCQSHLFVGYPETTGATSRKISLDFATDKTVNKGRP